MPSFMFSTAPEPLPLWRHRAWMTLALSLVCLNCTAAGSPLPTLGFEHGFGVSSWWRRIRKADHSTGARTVAGLSGVPPQAAKHLSPTVVGWLLVVIHAAL